MKYIRLILLFIFISFSSATYSQYITVKGTLYDAYDKETIIAASLTTKRSNYTTQSDVDGKYSLTVQIGDTIVVSYFGYKKQQWKAVEAQKDFFMDVDCASITWDGYTIFRKHGLSVSTLYATKNASWGTAIKYQHYFEPFSCDDYGNSITRRLGAFFAPSISYIRPNLQNNDSQLLAIGLIDKGRTFIIKPIRSSLAVYGTAGYYFDFDKNMKHRSNNFKFDINLNVWKLKLKLNQLYNLTFSTGYSFFINSTKYNNVFLSVSLNKNDGYMIGGDGCSHRAPKPKCKWYDKIFF